MAKKGLKGILQLDYISSDFILKNLPFVLFLGFLAVIYIANVHFAQRNVRQIQLLKRELKDLRWEYMSLESDNMVNSKRSEVARDVKDQGLYVNKKRPKVIVLNQQQ